MTKKSGLRRLKSGEILFEDASPATSLFIIQKGQIRLFKPKGKGFIEIAVLRPGEVVGEMAYFDDGKGRVRSCGAEAIVPSEIIEVSYAAFGKTIESLNPWFKTIFTTLASRLRKTNSKVKALESNSVSHGYGSDSGYKFLNNTDIVKSLASLFLVMSTHGEKNPEGVSVHIKTLSYYAQDIYNITEAKFLAFLQMLQEGNLISYSNDDTGQPKILVVQDINQLRNLLFFFNTQRATADDKKIFIEEKCLLFLEKILVKAMEEKANEEKAEISIKEILDDYKNRNISIDETDLKDAQRCGYVGEPILGSAGEMSLIVRLKELRKDFMALRVIVAIDKLNKSKTKGRYD